MLGPWIKVNWRWSNRRWQEWTLTFWESELKWTRMGEFNIWPLYLLLWARIPENKWSSPHSQQKSPKCSTWVQSQKWQNDFCSFPRQTVQYHSNPSLCPNHNAKEAEVEWFYEDVQDLLVLTAKKGVLFIIGDCNAKVGSQEKPGVTDKFGLGVQNEPGQRLTEFCQENTLVIVNTLFWQHKKWLYTWTSPDGQYLNHTDYILCSWRWRNSVQSAKTRLGADYGSDHELLVAKFRLKFKKVGKTTRQWKWEIDLRD